MKKVDIMLDKQRNLAFPLMSIIRLKKEYGVQLQDLSDEKKAQDMETILAVVWAGLIHEDKDLTMEEVGYMIDIAMLPEVSAKLAELFGGVESKNLQK